MSASTDSRAGFASVVGRPNVGKSTLVNAMVGQKIAITSDRPQTTRHSVRGVVNRPTGQLVLVDTPGVHRPKTLLGQRLNDDVRNTVADVDVVVFAVAADEATGPGDRFIAQDLVADRRTPKVVVVTKADRVSRDGLALRLLDVQTLGEQLGIGWSEILPVSAVSGENVDMLTDLLVALLPLGPALYPDGEVTDEPDDVMVAELIREAALLGVRDELPHSLAVVVEEMKPREGAHPDRPLYDVYAVIYVERQSQKAIVLGPSGTRLRDVGIRARAEIEKMLGTHIYLDLHVKIAKDWQRDPKQLQRLGF